MKSIRIIYITILVANLIMVSGCSEEFITKPLQPGTVSDVAFRKTPQGLEYTLNTSYAQLSGDWFFPYAFRTYMMGNLRSDDAHIGGKGGTDDPSERALNDFIIYPTNFVFQEFWRGCYTAIQYANAVVYSAPGALEAYPDSSATINRYVGEAKCLRAYFYFDLVRQYGNIPLVLDASVALRGSTNRLLIYDQIENDLLEAAIVLPKANELSPKDKGRMNNGSALAILAKVYLFRASLETGKSSELNTKAYETAKTVINSGQFVLLPTYDAVWRGTADFSSEGIVEAGQAKSDEYKKMDRAANSLYLSPRQYYEKGSYKIIDAFFGYGFLQPTQDFVNDFEAGDPRKNWSVFQQGDSSKCGSGKAELQEICFVSVTSGYNTRKFTPDVIPASKISSVNLKYYRYSDLLLVGAEAANEINQTTDALAWLELVRSRARNTPAASNHSADKIEGSPVEITTTDQTQLRTIIRHERRVELGLEGQRFYDLVRWDGTYGYNFKTIIETAQTIAGPNFKEDGSAVSGLPRSGRTVIVETKHKLSPIPDSEIKSSGYMILQNEGY